MALSSDLRTIMYRGLARAPKMRPWLMLPPWFEGGEMVYRFYDLVEKRQVSVEKRGVGGGASEEVPHDDSVVVGSSQGWLALFNKRNRDLFLSNPLTRRHIKLSPLEQLQIPTQELIMSDLVRKVIPACDPNDGRLSYCIMIYGPREQLAFCTPRGIWRDLSRRSYGDCTYCSKYEVFFAAAEEEEEVEAWNVQMYKKEWMVGMGNQGDLHKQLPSCSIHRSLVVAEHRLRQLQLYDVARYVHKIDHKTVGFAVRKYNWDEKAWRHMDGSLDGLSFFLGRNDSFATDLDCPHPHLKRDAIYFTDHHDVGMFCYATQQLSSLYYPRLHNHASTSTTTTAPIFFTPSTRI